MQKGSKNIKMLKDVGMTVPKSRETSVVYICSNTGNEETIFICGMKAVHNMHQDMRGMRACNNNNMRNPIMLEM